MNRGTLISLALLFLSCGCSNRQSDIETLPVTGVVLYQGKPEADVVLTFYAQEEGGANAQARTNEAGEFTVATMFDMGKREQSGMVPGTYRVTATKIDTSSLRTGQMVPKELLPTKYARPGTSGLEVTVAAGEENHHVLQLK